MCVNPAMGLLGTKNPLKSGALGLAGIGIDALTHKKKKPAATPALAPANGGMG